MKLQPDKSNAPTINAYDRVWIEVNGVRHGQSLSVSSLPDVPPAAWATGQFEALSASDFSPWAQSGAELIVRGIGVETMDTAAACRTYNILASEGRKVVALLLIES
jgi:uncharacterized protein